MVQIINDPNRTSSSQWANSLSQSINRLAEQKVQQIGQQRLYDSLVAGGVDPTHARVLTRLTPEERMSYFQNLGGFGMEQGQQVSQGPEAQDIQTTLQSLSPEQTQQMPQLPPLLGEEALTRAVRDYQKRQQPPSAQQFIQQQGEKGQQRAQTRPTGLAQPVDLRTAGQSQLETSRTGAKPSVAQILGGPTPEQRLKIAALNQAREFHQEKLSAKEQENVDKETKPFYDEISKGAKAAKENNVRLGRMEELINRGKLNAPFWIGAIENLKEGFKIPVLGTTLSLDLSAALHPDTQEFQKLSTDFIKTAKDYFGSRITEGEVNTFLKTIPNVAQSNEGKRRVIQNLKSFNEIALLRKKAADQIVKENGGRRPRDFDSLVEDKIRPDVDKIAKQFKENTSNNESLLNRIPVVGGLLRSVVGT